MTINNDVLKVNKEYYNKEFPYSKNEKNWKSLSKNNKLIVDSFLNKSYPNSSVLDIGCGVGSLTKELVKHTNISKIICLDLSEKMLKVLKENLDMPINQNITFVCDDAIHFLKNSKEKFDIITIKTTLHHIYEYKELLSLSLLHLKEQGRILILEEPLPKTEIDSFLDKLLSILDIGVFKYAKIKISGKNKDFQKEGELLDYWSYDERGFDMEAIKEIFIKNNCEAKLIKTHQPYNSSFVNLLADFLYFKNTFSIVGKYSK